LPAADTQRWFNNCPVLFANRKQETDQTVLIITKALTNTSNCIYKANVPIFSRVKSNRKGKLLC